ncbi:MAG: BrnT family toxin [Acetobacteraceae bacterium]
MEFEWDESKRASNLSKHGVDFAAVEAFEWETAAVQEDRRRDYGEQRWSAQGIISGRVHTLSFAVRGTRVRVISLRTASRKERAAYGQAQAHIPHR